MAEDIETLSVRFEADTSCLEKTLARLRKQSAAFGDDFTGSFAKSSRAARRLDSRLSILGRRAAGTRRELSLLRRELRGGAGDVELFGGTLDDWLTGLEVTTRGLREEFGGLFDDLGLDIPEMTKAALDSLGVVGEATDVLANVVDGLLNPALRRTIENWRELGSTGVEALDAILLKILEVVAAAAGLTRDGGGGGLFDILGGIVGAIGGIFGGAGGAGASPGSGSTFGGAGGFKFSGLPGLAGGGRVARGSPVVVGERGRELFVPDVPGTVLSHGETRSLLAGAAGPAASVTINQAFDFSNADRSTVGQLFAVAERIKRETKAELFRDIERGGGAAQIVGRRRRR